MIECCGFLCPFVSSCALVEKQLKAFPITASLDVLLVSKYTARGGDGNANDHLTAQCKINAHHFYEVTVINSAVWFFRIRLN